MAVSQSCGKFPKSDVQHIVAVTALIFPAHTPDASDTPRRGCSRSRGSNRGEGDLGSDRDRRGKGQWQAKHHQTVAGDAGDAGDALATPCAAVRALAASGGSSS